MKKLIYPLILMSASLYAAPPVQEIVNPDDGKQIVSVVKDLQVQDMLEKTSEFKDCRDKNKFVAGDSQTIRTNKLKEAEDCFKKKLASVEGKEKLKSLSEALNLQHYGLVQSKNVKDIQGYLADKMYKSLTGVDRKAQKESEIIEAMKFKNKKHIDQKLFIEMYRSQLGKNALFEVSRFCFENLRSTAGTAPTKKTFTEHWAGYQEGSLTAALGAGTLSDSGEPKFAETINNPDDKTEVYKQIFESIQGANGTPQLNDAQMSSFFMECGKVIVPLCQKFQASTNVTANLNTIQSTTDAVPVAATTGTGSVTLGASACLAKNRIQEYRKALADTEKVAEQFNEMAATNDLGSLLLRGEPIKLFESGRNGNETIDDLTNFTSDDVLSGGFSQDELAKQKAEKCAERAELAECEGFLTNGEDLEKAKHNVEMELTLKRDVEMARVRKLVQESDQSLPDYLKENGFFDLLKDDKYKTMKPDDLANAIGASYEAKKQATLISINQKLGKRQVSEKASPTLIEQNAKDTIKESKEERSRLAQVVLFNNIITSHLSLKKKDASGNLQEAGRNVNAWKKEETALTASRVDPALFQNLKASAAGETGLGKDNQIAGFELLDEILGKEKKAGTN